MFESVQVENQQCEETALNRTLYNPMTYKYLSVQLVFVIA